MRSVLLHRVCIGINISFYSYKRFKNSHLNKFRNKNRSFIIITHYQRLLDYINPDFIHVLIDGKIVKSGGKEIANELESRGYNWIKQ